MKKTTLPNHPIQKPDKKDVPELPGYPIYPPGEDVFSQWRNDREISFEGEPEIDLPFQKDLAERKSVPDFTDDVADGNQLDSVGDELDVPGSELDDAGENIGSEDEENNYYSIGGERHDDLEEDRGEPV